MDKSKQLLAIAVYVLTIAIPMSSWAQASPPNYKATLDCSSSGRTGRLSGSIRVHQPTNAPVTQPFSVTLPNCGRTFDDAEIYLRGWKIGRWSDSRFDTAITISVRKLSYNPTTGDFGWELSVNSVLNPGDETEYYVVFEILQVTNGWSGVQRVAHSCSGPGGCSVTNSVPLPPLPVRGLALASMTLSTSVSDPFIPGPTEVMADVSQFTATTTQLDTTMSCRFDRAGASGACDTESVIVSAADFEAATGDVAVSTSAPITAATISSILVTDKVAANFRLCGQERFRLSRGKPNPPDPLGGRVPNDTTYAMWAGAPDDTGGEMAGCGARNAGSFTGGWWYFFGSASVFPAPYVKTSWFDPGVPSGEPYGTMSFDADATILATKFY